MLNFFNRLVGIPLVYIGNYSMLAACWFLGEEEMMRMGCIRKDEDE